MGVDIRLDVVRMRKNNPLCRKLLVSWSLTIVGLLLMTVYGHFGLIMAIVPVAIAQNMRREHDKGVLERFREQKIWKGFALAYYVGLLIVTIIALVRGIRLDQLPILLFIIMIMFPVFVGMIANDLRVCRK